MRNFNYQIGQLWLSGKSLIQIIEIDTRIQPSGFTLIGKYLADGDDGTWYYDGSVLEDEGKTHPEDLDIQITEETHPEYFL